MNFPISIFHLTIPRSWERAPSVGCKGLKIGDVLHRRTERQMYSMFQVTEAEILFFPFFFFLFFFLCRLSGGHGIPAFLFLLPSRIFDILCHPFLFFLPLPLQYISVLSCCLCSFCPYFFSFSSHPLLDRFAFIPSPLPVHNFYSFIFTAREGKTLIILKNW